MAERTLQGALTFLGFVLATFAIVYFAAEFVAPLSEWTKIAALLLAAVAFVYLGVYFQQTAIGVPFFDGPRLRWLRPAVVAWLLGLMSVIWADIVFFGTPGLPRPLKVLATLALGIALIVVAARMRKAPSSAEPQGP